MRRRLFKLGVLALLLGVGVGWPVSAHYRLKGRLARYRQQLRAAGEKLSIPDLAPVPSPESVQAGQDLLAAAMYLTPVTWSNYPDTMKYIGPGRAMVGWQQEPLSNSTSRNVWPGLHLEMAANEIALERVRLVLRSPELAYNLDYRQGPSLLLPHLARLKMLSQQLAAATILDLHEDRVTNAFENLRALMTLTQEPRDEPLVISELVRIAITAIAANATWEALQCRECPEQELAALQSAWERLDFLSQAELALSMERVGAEKSFMLARGSSSRARSLFSGSGNSSAWGELTELGKGVLENPHAGLRTLLNRYPGYWIWRWWQSYDDELAQAQVTQAALESLRRAQREKVLGPAIDQFDAAAVRIQRAHPSAGVWMGSGLTNFMQRYLIRLEVIELQRTLTAAAIALKRYEVRHGTYPPSLAALVPGFTAVLPRDPIDGKPLRYRLNPDGSFVLYSIGEDRVDNGGDATPMPTATKQWARARDAVWPWPANEEQIKAAIEKNRR